jgi:hypothetical protein
MPRRLRGLDAVAVSVRRAPSRARLLAPQPILEQIMADVRDSFLHKLGGAELARLTAELEPIAFGGNTAAREAARQEALMESSITP